MKMTSRKLADLLKQRLQHENRSFFFDREKDTLRVEDQTTKKGITLELKIAQFLLSFYGLC